MIDLKKYKNKILFLPLGGSGEIGMNCNLYQYDGKWIIIDCGIGFAKNIPGVDIVVPDITFIKQNIKNFVGIVITHIHEDHIGSIQYLWEELRLPVYLSNFAKLFLKEKLAEYKFGHEVEMREIREGKDLILKPFTLEFVGLTHSTPDMMAVIIKTKKGNILHTGDWKFDKNPPVGEVSNLKRLKQLGKNKEILAITCDSTNIFTPGYSKSEAELYKPLLSIFKRVKGMVVCTTFSSNVSRLVTIITSANKSGRKVVILGRSIDKVMKVARKAGYLPNHLDIITEKEIKKYKKREILVISAGSQGEERATTSKIAKGVYRDIKLDKNDAIVFSSKIIPGNERGIFDVYNIFAQNDVEIITEKNDMVHVSGHYTRDDLIDMYSLVKPKVTIAVHGENMHLAEHKRIAAKCGIEHIIKAENGAIYLISADKMKVVDKIELSRNAVDGKRLLAVNGTVLQDRKSLINCGVIFANIIINDKFKLITNPVIDAPGLYNFESDKDMKAILLEAIGVACNNSYISIEENKSNKFESELQKVNFIKDAVKKSIQLVISSDFDKTAFIRIEITII